MKSIGGLPPTSSVACIVLPLRVTTAEKHAAFQSRAMMYLHVFQDVNHLNVMTGGIGPELTVAAVRRLTPSSVCGQLRTSEAVTDFTRTEGLPSPLSESGCVVKVTP